MEEHSASITDGGQLLVCLSIARRSPSARHVVLLIAAVRHELSFEGYPEHYPSQPRPGVGSTSY